MSAGVQVEVCMLRVLIVADSPVQVRRHVTAVYVISSSVAQMPSA